MPSISQIVDLLDQYDALEIGAGPWPEVDPDDYVRPVDWGQLFPARRQEGADPWQPDLPGFPGVLQEDANRPPPSDDELGGEISDAGWDTCAWYQPIHFHGFGWGIFIQSDCLVRQARWIYRFIPAPKRRVVAYQELLRASFAALFLHEQFHHKIESLGLRLLVADRANSFIKYHKCLYEQAIGTDDQLEEALANADSYRRLDEAPYARWISRIVLDVTWTYLDARFPLDPPGYRRAPDYLARRDFEKGENLLQTRVHEAVLTPAQPASEWDSAPRMTQSIFNLRSNIWEIVSPGGVPTLPGPITPAPSCSSREFIRLVESEGGREIPRQGKGSHRKFRMPDGQMVIVPQSAHLSPVVLRNSLGAFGHRLPVLPDLLQTI